MNARRHLAPLLGGLVLLTALVPRLALPGRIPTGQPQWAIRGDWFWQALRDGRLADTLLAPHPGLTVMWLGGAAQRLVGAEGVREKMLASSFTMGIASSLLILAIAWLVRKLLADEGDDIALPAALAAGLLLALDPFMILLTGLVGLDGPVSLLIVAGLLTIARFLTTGSRASFWGAVGVTALAVTTKAPGLWLLAFPLALRLVVGGSAALPWPRVGRLVLAQALGIAVLTGILLPAIWVDPWGTLNRLLWGDGGAEESLAQVLVRPHIQYFLGESSRDQGPLFYVVQLLFRTTPVVLLGFAAGFLVPRFRASTLARASVVALCVFVLGMSLVAKKSWRYVAPGAALLDLCGALGLAYGVRALAGRWRRPFAFALGALIVALQGSWVLAGAPYYSLRLNPLLGGPRRALDVVQLGWGEGMEQVIEFLDGLAVQEGRTITWSGGYGKDEQRTGLEFDSRTTRWIGRNPLHTLADCHVFYLPNLQRIDVKANETDLLWEWQGDLAHTVEVFGVPLARVRCQSDLSAAGEARLEVGTRPHAILLLTLDTTRADHLSAYGYARATSPVLARIASWGVRFDRAISPMPTTDPSHLAMLTGLFPRTHGSLLNGVPLADPTLPNLASWARGIGYRTAAFVSRQHLVPSDLGLAGFDSERGPSNHHSSRATATIDDALAWLDQNADHPFFLWVHLFDPHFPYEPPAELADRFRPPGSKSWPAFVDLDNVAGALPSVTPAAASGGGAEDPTLLPPVRLTRKIAEVLIDRYDAEIAYMDGEIGRLVQAVRAALPPDEAPLVVVAADHGEVMDELLETYSYAFGHGTYLNQGSLVVPLLLWWEGHLPAGLDRSAPVQLVDLAPTLFELVGEDGFPTQGRSLLPLIRIPGDAAKLGSPAGRRLAFSQRKQRPTGEHHYAVQDQRHKLYVTLPGPTTRLYDLEADPGELVDLADRLPWIERRLLRELRSWMRTTPEATGLQEVPSEKIEALRALGYVD